MEYCAPRPIVTRWENHLLGLSSLVAVISLSLISATPGPRLFTIPEVIIPLGLSLALSVYTVRLQRGGYPADRFKPMVKYGWAGAVISAAIGGSWMALHLHYGLPIDVLPDKILTILSAGIAAGVYVGRTTSTPPETVRPPDRERVLAETSWTNRPSRTPVVAATIDLLVELEGVDRLELAPLYHDVDPEILADLRSQDGGGWQFAFYTHGYEVRVSSQGTVTVYGRDTRGEASPSARRR